MSLQREALPSPERTTNSKQNQPMRQCARAFVGREATYISNNPEDRLIVYPVLRNVHYC